MRVELPADGAEVELVFDLTRPRADALRVVLRRVRCRLADGLLRRDEVPFALPAQTRAALLWRTGPAGRRPAGRDQGPADPGKREGPPAGPAWFAGRADRVRAYLAEVLTDDARLLLKWCALLHDVGKPGTRTLRPKGTGPEVQFLGHELYGLAVLDGRLAAWFPGKDDRCRLAALIRNHHRSHQRIGDHLLRPAADGELPVAGLYRLLDGETDPAMSAWLGCRNDPRDEHYRPDLALLLLHGFADRVAARGPRQPATIGQTADATLGLLTYLACADELAAAEAVVDDGKADTARAALAVVRELVAGGQVSADEFDRAIGVLKELAAGYRGEPGGLCHLLRQPAALADLCRLLDERKK